MSEYNDILSELITDRTASDITNKTSKAYYNVSDYARINNAIQYLSDELGLGLTVEEITLGQSVTRAQMDAILNNIATIRAAWIVASDTPTTPQAINWNYTKANNIEKILQALIEFWKSQQIDKIYSGTFKSGNHIKFRGDK